MAVPLGKLFPPSVRFGLKVGIACTIAYTVSYFLSSPHAVWAVVSSVVAMQINVADSIQAGLQRIAGTIIGAILGISALLTIPPNSISLIGLGIFILTAACGVLTPRNNRYSMVSIASVIVFLTGISMTHENYQGAIVFGLARIFEIAIGVGVAFLVSMLLWPVRLLDTLRTDMNQQFAESAALLDTITAAFLGQQEHIESTTLEAISAKVWANHAQLIKTRKHESYLYQYEDHVMEVQITILDRTVEALRTLLESLNDYAEERYDSLMSAEIRSLADACMSTLRHLGSSTPAAAAPDLVRRLTGGVDQAELRLAELRACGATRSFDLHKILQLFTFYQTLRMFTEYLLIALEKVQRKEDAD